MSELACLSVCIIILHIFTVSGSQRKPKPAELDGGKESSVRPLSNGNVVVQVVNQDTAQQSQGNRSCYDCDYEIDGESCLQLNGSLMQGVLCPKDYMCKVWHFYSTTDEQETYYFQRECAKTCQPGCTSLDDTEHKRFISCSSCCTEHLCNVDNKADRSVFRAGLLLVTVLMTWIAR